MVLKSVLVKKKTKKTAFLMAQMAKNWQKLVTTKMLTPKTPFFCIKDKNIYTNVGHIWAYVHTNSEDFWKSFNRSDKTKKCGKKIKK